MKLIISILLYLTFSFTCFSQSSDVIYIGQASSGGIRNNDFLIGENSIAIKNIQKSEKSVSWDAKSSIVSHKTFAFLKQFVLKQCNDINSSNENTSDFIVIKVYSGGKFSNCYLVGKVQIESYFKSLSIKSKSISDKNQNAKIESLCSSVIRIVNYNSSR